MNTDPLIFNPYYKSVIWGGTAIAGLKGSGVPQGNVGESWEVSAIPGHESVVAAGPYAGRTLSDVVSECGAELLGRDVEARFGRVFPVLVKIIDACHDLSLQVHPNDEIARRLHGCSGKAEMWYVMEATPQARIYSGFSAPFSREDYRRSVADGSIMRQIACHDSARGQFYYIPPGTVHTLTQGNMVIEVQQSSDITYRIYDYGRLDSDGRPRPLHVSEAADAINFAPGVNVPKAHVYGKSTLGAVRCEHFVVDYYRGEDSSHFELAPDGSTFMIVIAVDADLTMRLSDGRNVLLPKASTALIPASSHKIDITTAGTVLVVTMPPLQPSPSPDK